jgi:hypothetical protein
MHLYLPVTMPSVLFIMKGCFGVPEWNLNRFVLSLWPDDISVLRVDRFLQQIAKSDSSQLLNT